MPVKVIVYVHNYCDPKKIYSNCGGWLQSHFQSCLQIWLLQVMNSYNNFNLKCNFNGLEKDGLYWSVLATRQLQPLSSFFFFGELWI